MIYTLKNKFYQVDISDAGAEIKRIKFKGLDYLHDSNPEYWGKSAPLLWPHVGVNKDGYTIINKKEYALKRHGIVREILYQVKHKSDTSIIFELHENEETLKVYPFKFTLTVSYELKGNKILSSITTTNNSLEVLPFNLGLHPAFKLPITSDYTPLDYRITFQKKQSYDIPRIDCEKGTIDFNDRYRSFKDLKELEFNYSDYDYDALVFENFKSKYVILSDKNHTHGVKFNCKMFPMLGIWTPIGKNAPFVCLEPWCGCADTPDTSHEFLTKRDMQFVNPGKSKTFKYSFELF